MELYKFIIISKSKTNMITENKEGIVEVTKPSSLHDDEEKA